MRYAELLNEYIGSSGKTLDQLVNECSKLGVKVHATYISKLRKGNRDVPSEEITRALAIACGRSPEELLTAGRLEKAPAEIVELHEEYEELSNLFYNLRNDDNLLSMLLKSQNRYKNITELQNSLDKMTISDQLKFLTSHGLKLSMIDKTDGTTNVEFSFTPTSLVSESEPQSLYAANDNRKVPLLGRIKCGVPLLDESNWDEQITAGDIPADFAARADGDSMLFAGIRPGDRIISFNGNDLTDLSQPKIQTLFTQNPAATSMAISVKRDSQKLNLVISKQFCPPVYQNPNLKNSK